MTLREFFGRTHLHRAVLLWIILAASLGIKFGCFGTGHSVFPVFAASSHHWWADKSLYADYWFAEGLDGYRYSPAFAIAFSPLASLPPRIGAILWGLLSIGLLLWALHRLAVVVLPHDRELRFDADSSPGKILSSRPSAFWEGIFLTLALLGSIVGIWSGQANALMLAMILLSLVAVQREHWWIAATFLAIPVFIKIWPMAIVLLLMVFWPRQLIGRFVVIVVALFLLPFCTRPPHSVWWQYQEWYRGLTGPLQGRWPGYRDAWTIWEQSAPLFGLKANWAGVVSHRIYSVIQLITAFGVFVWCVWQRRRAVSTKHLLTSMFAIWAAWQLLFGPGTEQLTYGLIAPATSWAVLISFAERKARWMTVTAWSILTFLPSGDIEEAVRRIFPAAPILLPLGVALFIAWLLWHESGVPAETQSLREPSVEKSA